MKRRLAIAASLTAAVFLIGCGSPDIQNTFGRWRGAGAPGNDWCARDHVSITLHVGMGGLVNGTVGDASMRRGTLKVMRQPPMGLQQRDFVVEAELTGSLLSDLDVARATVWMALDLVDGRLVGELTTDGARVGGLEDGRFRAADIILESGAPRGRR